MDRFSKIAAQHKHWLCNQDQKTTAKLLRQYHKRIVRMISAQTIKNPKSVWGEGANYAIQDILLRLKGIDQEASHD